MNMLRLSTTEHKSGSSMQVLPNAAVVYSLQQHVAETFDYLRSEDRLSLPSGNVVVALSSIGQLLGLVEADIERLLDLDRKQASLELTGMSYSEFLDAVRCCAVLHGHLALEALPTLQVPDLSHALYKTYLSYSQAQRPPPGGARCQCRLVAGEPPPRLYWESFSRLCRDAGFLEPEGPMPLLTLERIWRVTSSVCARTLPEHMCFGQFLRSLAVLAGQLHAEVFVPVAALGLTQELPVLKPVPNNYRFKHYREVPLNLGGHWSLPDLTLEAITAAVREGRQYDYGQMLRDAQQLTWLDEVQQAQWRRSAPAASAPGQPGNGPTGQSGAAGAGSGGSQPDGLAGRSFSVSGSGNGTGGSGGGGGADGNGASARRPFSAGLKMLSPRRGAPPAKTEAEGGGGGLSAWRGGGGGALASIGGVGGGVPLPNNLLTGGAVEGGWVVGDAPGAARPTTPPSPPGAGAGAAGSTPGVNRQPAVSTPELWALPRGGRTSPPLPSTTIPPPLLISSNALEPPGGWLSGSGGSGGGSGPPPALRVRCRSALPSRSAASSPRVGWAPPGQGPTPSTATATTERVAFEDLRRAPSFRSGGRPSSARPLVGSDGEAATPPAPAADGGGGGGGLGGLPRAGPGRPAADLLALNEGEFRQAVDSRLSALEAQGRAMMQVLTQIQTHVGALLANQQPQPQCPYRQPPPQTHQLMTQQPGQQAAAEGLLRPTGPVPGGYPLAPASPRGLGSAKGQGQSTSDGAPCSPVPSQPDESLSEGPLDIRTPAQELQPGLGSRGLTQLGVAGTAGPISGGDAGSAAAVAASPASASAASGAPSAADSSVRYEVALRTSDRANAGTNVHVFVTLYGTLGDTGEFALEPSSGAMESGEVHTFCLDGPPVGPLRRLRVRSNGTGPRPRWHLEAVLVGCPATATTYTFAHDDWLDAVSGLVADLECSAIGPWAAAEGAVPTGVASRAHLPLKLLP